MSARTSLHVLSALVLLAGCAAGPDYHPAQHGVPGTFSPVAKANALEADPSVSLEIWWTVFHDSQLSSLIRSAAMSNLDLRLAAARVLEARAQRGVASSELFPHLGSTADYARSRVSKHSIAGGQLTGQNRPLENGLFDAGIDMSWEIDVFGGTHRAAEAANARLGATVESGHAAMVTVMAEVGLTYLDLRGVQRQLSIARDNLRTQEETAALAEDRFKSGLAGELDASRALGEVARTRAQIPPLEEARERALYRLDVLLGKNPGELDAMLGDVAPIPTAPPRVPLGLPSDLLRQRPDIRQAERQLAAATAQVGVAAADLFPKFYLTGGVGLQSIESADFFTAGSRYWSIGPKITWPLFSAGKIRQNIHVQTARQEQAAIVYEKTVLIALEETQTALVAFGQEQERHRALVDAENASRRSFTFAKDRYRGGLVAFLDVLEAERSLLAAQDAVAQGECRLSQNLIRVFKALGGGWSTDTYGFVRTR